MTTTTIETELVNGIAVQAIGKLRQEVERNAKNGLTRWGVTTRWAGGTQTESQVYGYDIGNKRVARNFRFRTDEPLELAGANASPNPQEYLIGAFNACMVTGFAMLASLRGIQLESVEIETKGEIDLRGFLGLDPAVKPGFEELHYTFRVRSSASESQVREVFEYLKSHSPNQYNLANPIKLNSDLIVE